MDTNPHNSVEYYKGFPEGVGPLARLRKLLYLGQIGRFAPTRRAPTQRQSNFQSNLMHLEKRLSNPPWINYADWPII